MLTRRDMLRAQAHVRRRLVAAFVTGVAEVSDRNVRPLRSTLVGAIAAALVLGGTWAVGQLRGRPPSGWLSPDTVVVEAETGHLLLVRAGSGELTPVPNLASARLLAGKAELRTVVVERRWIRRQPAGPTRGIEGAPRDLEVRRTGPGEGWSSCAAPEVTSVAAPGTEQVTVGAFAVAAVDSRGTRWLVLDRGTGVRRHELAVSLTRLPALLGLPVAGVPDTWLDLIPRGLDLAPRPEPGDGTPTDQFPVAASPGGTVRQGDVVASAEGFARVRADRIDPINVFDAMVQQAATGRAPLLVSESWPLSTVAGGEPAASAWPTDLPQRLPSGAVACLQAGVPGRPTAETDGSPVRLGYRTGAEVSVASAQTSAFRVTVGADWLLARGARVAEAQNPAELVVLVEGSACFPVLGTDASAALGLEPQELATLPSSWADLFKHCQVLSVERAGQVVGVDQGPVKH